MMTVLLGAFTIKSVGYVLIALVALMIMITVHELGHYTAGKLLGFNIKEFALGFGPAMYKKTMKSGELFSVRVLPIGGFCAFLGEDEDNDAEGAFNAQAPWKRIIVLLAGVTFNFIFAIIILGLYFNIYGYTQPTIVTLYTPAVVETPQAFENGDVLLEVNGRALYTCAGYGNLSRLIAESDTNTFTVERGGEIITFDATKSEYVYEYEDGTSTTSIGYGIGVGYTAYRFRFFGSLWRGVDFSFRLIGVTFKLILQLIAGQMAVKGNLGGTLTTIQVVSQTVGEYGFQAFFSLLGIMSASIAMMNALPIPALDGSRVVFTVVEWIRGKPINREVEGKIHFVGLAVLLAGVLILDMINLFG